MLCCISYLFFILEKEGSIKAPLVAASSLPPLRMMNTLPPPPLQFMIDQQLQNINSHKHEILLAAFLYVTSFGVRPI
jgi:hypothetical protein